MRWSRASSVAGRSVDASMMDILSAAAIAANQKKQVAVNLNAAVPGIAGTKLTLAIGEPPKELASTPSAPRVRSYAPPRCGSHLN